MPVKKHTPYSAAAIRAIVAKLSTAARALEAVADSMDACELSIIQCTTHKEMKRGLNGIDGFAKGASDGYLEALHDRDARVASQQASTPHRDVTD